METTRRRVLGLGLTGLGLVAAIEAAAVRRVRHGADTGGRDHAGAVGEGIGQPLVLVLLGDSAVDGYGLRSDQALPRQLAARVARATGRRVVVRSTAVSGATTSDVAAFQLPLLRAAGRVDAVLVGVGVNDVLRRTRVPVLQEATRQLVAGLRDAAPGAALAVATCPDLTAAPGLGPVLRRVVGLRCRRVAGLQRAVLEEHGVPVVEPDRTPPAEMFGADGLHPGPAGVEALADLAVARLVAT